MGFNFDRISTMILNFIRVCDLKLYNCEKLSNQLYSLEMLNTHRTRPILPFIHYMPCRSHPLLIDYHSPMSLASY